MAELKKLQQEVNPAFELEIEFQTATGTFEVNYRGFHPITNSYIRVHNIVARVSRKGSSKEHALMLSTHFDTMISSSGASDAAACVVVLLETMRTMFVTDNPDSVPLSDDAALIVLLNGAEEFGLQAAHGFVGQHPWAKTIRSFVNLDSGGVGGKALLTQTGPGNSWIGKAFAKAFPNPHGSVLAQDLFQSGAVPSDTDFRVYVEFANTPGLDIVYYMNGYLYHTHKDSMDHMAPGSLQHLGNGVLGVSQYLLEDNRFSTEHSGIPDDGSEQYTDRAVYYSLYGMLSLHCGLSDSST
jgi:hypothetical protein